MALTEYWRKRDFKKTKEPSGKAIERKAKTKRKAKELSFVVQKHDASHLHYDFRLEYDGVLKSWSVPKGPSFDPADKRLAVQVEDHPIDYASFEGVIPAGEYGGGDVIVWDRGTWESEKDIAESLEKGRLEFSLKGEKLEGRWVLVRTGRPSPKPQWLLIKRHDEFARNHDSYDVVAEHPESVKTGNLLPRDEAGGDAKAGSRRGGKIAKGAAIWHSNRAPKENAVRTVIGAEPLLKKAAAKKKASVKKKSEKSAKTKFPGFIEPQLAKLVEAAPSGDKWIHEIKYDGYRAVTTIEKGVVTLWTRAGLDWTHRFGTLARECKKIKSKNVVLDGEVVFVDKQGRSSFSRLQTVMSEALKNENESRLVYYVFDILYLDGEDLRSRPLVERKAILKNLLSSTKSGRIRYSQDLTDEGSTVLDASCHLGMEGIISKRLDSLYESTRSGTWLKSKCAKGQEFIIGGFSSPKGSRRGFGALILGAYDDNDMLRYVGRVGTGFDTELLEVLYKKLEKLRVAETPFEANSPRERDITFVKPELVCQIRFSEWTKDKIIRHAVFDGLREDKDASLVRIEKEENTKSATKAAAKRVIFETGKNTKLSKPSKMRQDTSKVGKGSTKSEPSVISRTKKSSRSPKSGEFSLTHPDKVLYPEVGATKQDMAEYYKLAQKRILPHLLGRPLSLVRCPEGAGKECFFQKRIGNAPNENLHSTHMKGRGGEMEEILTVDDANGLYALVQMGVLEIHTWGCHVPEIEMCDLMVFDLDPDEGLSWKAVKDAAFAVKELLERLGLKTWIKTTGGKGLHIHVPILPDYTFDQIKEFSRSVVRYLEKEHPERYTSQILKSKRKGRIFIDYLRNGYGATAVAPYSLRSKASAAIATPITWDELRTLKGADAFNIRNIAARLRRVKDPWPGYFKARQKLVLRVEDGVGVDVRGKKRR